MGAEKSGFATVRFERENGEKIIAEFPRDVKKMQEGIIMVTDATFHYGFASRQVWLAKMLQEVDNGQDLVRVLDFLQDISWEDSGCQKAFMACCMWTKEHGGNIMDAMGLYWSSDFAWYPGVRDYEEYGREVFREMLDPMHKSWFAPYVDFAQIGEDEHLKNEGMFTEWGYIAMND